MHAIALAVAALLTIVVIGIVWLRDRRYRQEILRRIK